MGAACTAAGAKILHGLADRPGFKVQASLRVREVRLGGLPSESATHAAVVCASRKSRIRVSKAGLGSRKSGLTSYSMPARREEPQQLQYSTR